MGQVITFFSYKGGVGRTMALANTAVVLSQWGYKILMVDWDLEAPGLENFFRDYLDFDRASRSDGILDLFDLFLEGTPDENLPHWKDLALQVSLPEAQGSLHLLTSGHRNKDYFLRVRNLDLQTLYLEYNGGALIESLRNDWKIHYDFILLDSRTGVTDIGGVCTIQLPDIIVLLFTATEQAFGGAVEVAKKAALARQSLPYERLQVPVIPIPSRFDTQREFKLSQEWLRRFSTGLSELYSSWLPTSVDKLEFLELTKLPYVSYFSFGEKLPVLEQGTNDPAGLGYAYETLAGLLASRLERVEFLLEDRTNFLRTAALAGIQPARTQVGARVLLCYSHRDKRWADSLTQELLPLNKQVHLIDWSDERITAGHDWYPEFRADVQSADLVLLLVSADLLASQWVVSEEVPRLLTTEARQNLQIVPIIVRSTTWSASWLARLQALPKDGRALDKRRGPERESALAEVAQEVSDFLVISPSSLLSRENSLGQVFDVFLSYNSRDKSPVRLLAEQLRDRGLKVWLDEWELAPGVPWQEEIEKALNSTRSVLVLIGPNSLGPWENSEIRYLLAEIVRQKTMTVIPVLLPGTSNPPDLPLFLSRFTWVDLRGGLTNDNLDRLVWGITGVKPLTKQNLAVRGEL